MEETATRAALAELHDLPGHLLWRARARVSATVADLLPGTVDLHAYAALLALADHEPQSQQGLARMCGVSGTTMTAVAETLQAEGLVERIRNPADRRSYALTRTAAGRAAADRWAVDVHELEEHLTRALTPRDVTRLRQLLVGLIGDDLDPQTPAPLLDSIGFLLLRTHQRIHREFLAALGPLDIDPRHVGTMRALRAAGPATQGQLAAMLEVSPATVVQIVDHLEARGLVARERDPDDRRAYRLHLRPEATAVVAEAASISRAVVDARLGGPQGRDRQDLTRLLRKFLASPVAR